MSQRVNELGQPIGEPVTDWVPARYPDGSRMAGAYCEVVSLESKVHAADLFEAFRCDTEQRMWTYLSFGPFDTVEALENWLELAQQLENQVYYALIDKGSGKALGIASYLRIQPAHGVVEVGGIAYSPQLQRTVMATEAMFLMMKEAFEVYNYRRYEWKCDALNAASCGAAERLGFAYDGLFRQAIIYRERNRDTAWYSVLDEDWPALRTAHEMWLAPENFDSRGQQRRKLSVLIAQAHKEAAVR